MIDGITHEGGVARQQLSISHKVSIGAVVDAGDGRTRPTKLDHFRFQTRGLKGGWVEDVELTDMLASRYSRTDDGKVRAFPIILASNNLEQAFRTELALWSRSACLCRGDGVTAKRRSGLQPENPLEAWAGPCGQGCPERASGQCKPSGDLYFMFADRPAVGSVVVLHTSSYRSVTAIHSALSDLHARTGGRISGIPLMLVMRPFQTRYKGADGKPRSGLAYSLSVEYRAEDQDIMKRLMEQALENAPPPPVDVVDQLLEAGEIAEEFYPEAEEEEDDPPRTIPRIITEPKITDKTDPFVV